MGKLAILKSVSFGRKSDTSDLTNEAYISSLENKIEFKEFTDTLGMYYIIQDVFGANADIEITNCEYDHENLIQSFCVNDDDMNLHENIIFVKREILDNDTYTYYDFNPENPESDIYRYKDITVDDIVHIIKKKSVTSAIYVDCNGNIDNEKIVFLNHNGDVGKILLKNKNKEILYLNIANIVNQYKDDQNKIESLIKEKMNAYCTDHIFIQIDIGLCILNCYYKSFSEEKNNTVSQVMNETIYGDAIIYLQSKMNDDCESILNLDSELFSKISGLVSNKIKFKRGNPYFFNIYKELKNY